MSEQIDDKKSKPKFRVTRTFVGTKEDAERLTDVTLRLLRLDSEKKTKKAA